MSNGFFSELKRRNVFKATGGYILLGWLVLQIADVVVPALQLPEWTITLLLVIGMFGLPFVVFFAWVYEMTPEGLKLTEEVDKDESITNVTGKKIEYGIIAGLSIALLLVIVKPTIMPDVDDELVQNENSTAVTPIQNDGTPSIAVLPFEDFSPAKDQGYFSSGISEEILNLLAKTNKLRVAARTSSFAFRGDTVDIREIGEKLDVATVLEGSIRKAGDKIRITAQLINVADGYHIWSETYDRELRDVFAIQDEISLAILGSLKVHLLGEVINQPTNQVDIEAYDKFLIANERLNRNTSDDLEAAIKLYGEAISIAPDFTDAKVRIVLAALQLEDKYTSSREAFLKKEKYTDQLFSKYLEPLAKDLLTNYELNGVKGRYHQERFRYDVAEQYLETALKLNENYADAYLWRADLRFNKADYHGMLKDRETAYKLDPMSLSISSALAYDYRSFWRPEDANRIVERMFELYPNHPSAYVAKAANDGAYGKYAEATLVVEEAFDEYPNNDGFKDWLTWLYVYLDKSDKVTAMGTDWAEYEYSLRRQDLEKSAQILEQKLASEQADEWLDSAVYLYSTMGKEAALKSAVVKRIDTMDDRNVPWQKRCISILLNALQTVGMNDNTQTMMDRCRETTEKRLAAGYFCPCSWFNLVNFAVLDNRNDDAIKRAEEWLDHGDSELNLAIHPIFTQLKGHPKYQAILERNQQQIERQIRIYDNAKKQQEENTGSS